MSESPTHLHNSPLMNTYARSSITFVRGNGCLLYDSEGREYLDALAGIAVVSAGHANPAVQEAVAKQAAQLVHVSNLFWTKPMADLASKLHDIAGGWGSVFYGNSGAEANECAIKLARLVADKNRFKIICAEGSFHGRTLATLAATGQSDKWKGFEPLPDGFVFAPFNDLQAFADKIDAQTCAIMVEPIQGENGIIPATQEFLDGLRKLCDQNNISLIFDEIQCGMGRTGSWWAFQHYGVTPDIFTSAKALANGFPLGVCVVNQSIASEVSPGHHGSTFGGGPVICAAALASIDYIEQNDLVRSATDKGTKLKDLLMKIPEVQEVRGTGLMLGAVLKQNNAKAVAKQALSLGLVVNAVRDNTIRLTPPLVITDKQITQLVDLLGKAIIET